ncbi:PREDICTED: fatty-acid amide hydrolase 1-like [Condylura cristata]|uniref:fatty-acid amide hydrolase 1-like n=1 Tax=Condylura cristata TaxID=143302 RepID=UPI0006438161|nr:PREDICTED: fatty-acid amide hydrolase 1-like [Condylura cristata]
MLGLTWLAYSLVALLPLAILGAALLGSSLFWQQAPARNKIPRAQKRREMALQQMETLAQRLRQQEPELDPQFILELPLTKLVQKLKAEELSLESVLCSYLEQALKVHQKVNCLTDFLGECEGQLQALKKLKKSERGLLYGVPVSLKDTYDCMGHDSTCGLSQLLERPAAKDAVTVEVLKAQGAIPFVKTNVPQTLISFDCSNPIYGQTLNPLNLKKTPGGSSGGEGALLAEKGSILGMGTDTGGSLRIPASFCGVYSLRTTGRRLRYLVSGPFPSGPELGFGGLGFCSYSGIASAVQGVKTVTTAAGPMARDVESLALCLQALLSEDMHRLDPTVPPVPFKEEVYSSHQPLRIGYCESDGFTQPSPSMLRAMRLTSRLLQDAGHQVVPFSIPRGGYAFQHLFTGGLFADAGATLLEKLEGDIVDPCVKPTVSQLRLPDALKRVLAWILKYREPRVSQKLEEFRGVRTTKQLWEQHTAVKEYQQEFIAEWRSLGLDVLLIPTVDPAFSIGYPAKSWDSLSYLSLFNVLDFPAGVVPVTTVTLQDEEDLVFYKGYYGDSYDRNFQEGVRGSVGLPVAVQCIALPWEEELCLRFMKEIETLTMNQKKSERLTEFTIVLCVGAQCMDCLTVQDGEQGLKTTVLGTGVRRPGNLPEPLSSRLYDRQERPYSPALRFQGGFKGGLKRPKGLNSGGGDKVDVVRAALALPGSHRLAPGAGGGAEGALRGRASAPTARRPAAGPAPSQAPPRRRRFEVPIRQIESINYEGNNLAAPRGAAAERSRGIRPQIALSLPK